MKLKKILILIGFLGFFAYDAFAQSSGQPNEKNQLEFILAHKYPLSIVHQYYFRDSTITSRLYEDSTTINYFEDKIIHFNQKAPTRTDSEGFWELNVSIDSIYYHFIEGDKKIEYGSTWDEGLPPFNHKPYLSVAVNDGSEFTLKYSPYNEIVEISGERYEEKRKSITDPKRILPDSIWQHQWIFGTSLENLEQIVDLNKGILPLQKIVPDSQWIALVHNKVNEVHFIDTVVFKLVAYNTTMYTIKGVSVGKKILDFKTLPYKLDYLFKAKSIIGGSEYYLELSPRGAVEKIRIHNNLKIGFSMNNSPIYEYIENNQSWVLVERYKY